MFGLIVWEDRMARVSRKCAFEESMRTGARVLIIFGVCVGVAAYSTLRDELNRAFNAASSGTIAAQQTLWHQ